MEAALPGVELPPRGLNLSACVWGIDPSTRKCAVAVLLPGAAEPPFRTFQTLLGGGDEHRRLWGNLRLMADLFEEIRKTYPPAYVVVEQPFARGRNVMPISQYHVGVTLAALGWVVDGVVVHLRGAPQWKAAALGKGRGNAKPDQYLDWARRQGYEGSDIDEAAAVGIATAAGIWFAAEMKPLGWERHPANPLDGR